jgi:general stress protein 26
VRRAASSRWALTTGGLQRTWLSVNATCRGRPGRRRAWVRRSIVGDSSPETTGWLAPGSGAGCAPVQIRTVCYTIYVNTRFLERSAEILRTISYATIATADSQAHPWNSPVYSVLDDDLTIYWVSDKQNQHSQNVRQNPWVFIVFYDSTVPPGQGEGVYFSATASELSDREDIQAARQLIDHGNSGTAEEYSGNCICRIYRATPAHAWINTFEECGGVFIRDYRIEIPLSELRLAVNLPSSSHPS